MSQTRDPGPGPEPLGSGALSEHHGAVVAGVVIETRPGQGPFVACRLEGVSGLSIVGGDGDRRLAAVWTATSGRELERAADRLVQDDEDILGIFPTFIGLDEDDGPSAAEQARQGIAAADDRDDRP